MKGKSGRVSVSVVVALLLAVGGLLVTSTRTAAQAQPSYVVTDLGSLGGGQCFAYDLNNKGQVVGMSATAAGEMHAFLWEAGVIRDIGVDQPGNSVAFAISEAGEIAEIAEIAGSVNLSSAEHRAFRWRNGTMSVLPAPPGRNAHGYGINSAGDVVGEISASETEYPYAALWRNNTLIDLDPQRRLSFAYDINDSGLIVGKSYLDGDYQAVRWVQGAPAVSLDIRGEALAVNQAAAITGVWRRGTPYSPGAFIHHSQVGATILNGSAGRDINVSNQIVGQIQVLEGSVSRPHAWMWDPRGREYDLNNLIPSDLGYTLEDATAINDRGQIIAIGRMGAAATIRSFLLTPSSLVHPPPTLAATPVSPTSVQLSWVYDYPDVTEFEIQRKEPGGAFATVALVSGNTRAYEDRSPPLKAHTTYIFRMRALGLPLSSEWSSEVAVTTLAELPQLSLVRANLHSHSKVSDGKKAVTEILTKYVPFVSLGVSEGPQVWAVTDHYPDIDYPKQKRDWSRTGDALNSSTRFIGLRGFEWSTSTRGNPPFFGPHITVLGSAELPRTIRGALLNSVDELYSWLSRTNAVGQFNHARNHMYPWLVSRVDSRVIEQMALFEVGSGFYQFDKHGLNRTKPGRDVERHLGDAYTQSVDAYIEALLAGWRLGPVNNQDNHHYFGKGKYWITPSNNTGIWVDDQTREGVMRALRARRVFASEDLGLRILTSANRQNLMGSDGVGPAADGKLHLTIEASDDDESVGQIRVLAGPRRGGEVVPLWLEEYAARSYSNILELNYYPDHWYLVTIAQIDGDTAVASPVWTR